MCRHLVLLLVGTTPILSIGCGADSVQEAHRQTLVETREAWGRAIADGDVERILSFWTEDVVIYPVSEPAVRGIDAVRAYVAHNRRERGLTPRTAATEIVASGSGDLGYIVGTYEWIDREGRATLPGQFVELWRRDEEGAWKCFLEIHSPRPVEEENKEIVRRVMAEGVNRGDLEVFREMLAPDYVRHSQATTDMPEIRGVEQMLTFLEWNFTAFPDWHEEIDLMIAEGDKVAYITSGTGTHTGPMGDLPPTGKKVEVINFIVQRIEGGKIAETWVGWDNLAVLMQLGLFPPPDAEGE